MKLAKGFGYGLFWYVLSIIFVAGGVTLISMIPDIAVEEGWEAVASFAGVVFGVLLVLFGLFYGGSTFAYGMFDQLDEEIKEPSLDQLEEEE